MVKKAIIYWKRKRKACLIELAKNLTKKRKTQSLDESKAMESSTDLGENIADESLDRTREMSPKYAELQNVLHMSVANDDSAVTCDVASEATPEKQFEEDLDVVVESSPEATIKKDVQDLGHRIIDVHHFTTELIRISKHKSLFECGLATMKLISEHQNGLQSEFTFVCSMCSYKNKIKSSLDEVNKDAVAGTMAAGCGHVQLKQNNSVNVKYICLYVC